MIDLKNQTHAEQGKNKKHDCCVRDMHKNTKTEEKPSFEYLGITIDNELSFSKHSKHVVTKFLSNCSSVID